MKRVLIFFLKLWKYKVTSLNQKKKIKRTRKQIKEQKYKIKELGNQIKEQKSKFAKELLS